MLSQFINIINNSSPWKLICVSISGQDCTDPVTTISLVFAYLDPELCQINYYPLFTHNLPKLYKCTQFLTDRRLRFEAVQEIS